MLRKVKQLMLGTVGALMISLQAHSDIPMDGTYVGIQGGLAFMPKINIQEYKLGYNINGLIGLKTSPFRYEAEVLWAQNNGESGKGFVGTNGYTRLFGVLGNVHYDFEDLSMEVTPSIGVGIGYGRVMSKSLSNPANPAIAQGQLTDNAFAYQAKLQVAYHFTSEFSGTLGYRFLGTTKVNQLGDKIYQNHMVNVGVVWFMG